MLLSSGVSLGRGATTTCYQAARANPAARPRPAIRPAPVPASDALTPRETEVLRSLADGMSTPEIADELGITRNTLRTHIHNIMGKLGARSKLEAVLTAIREGIVDPPR
jgi:DNA-binding NarL/FixJ family response regulator